MNHWRISILFGKTDLSFTEQSHTEQGAIDAALRYARALGYSGHPTRIYSRRIA